MELRKVCKLLIPREREKINWVEKMQTLSLSNVNNVDRYGLSLLHYACIDQQEVEVEALIAVGADVNICSQGLSFKRSFYGWKEVSTPLHLAAGTGNQKIINLLLEKEAVLDSQHDYE